ncbi:metal-dependent hydrolase [Halobacterium wangiae]|uniref:metal-dependent hydrolase n=1 Tax=Halobacterium wangiae TaxID=2902623 RepID=UPI001E38896A|nr:metal-dependent hydrolase [Halobacterium wangiae]
MNERDHVINAVLLGVGVGVILDPSMTFGTLVSVVVVTGPVVLGALLPDLDTSFGTHRKTLHNFLTLGVVAAFPLFLDNLHWVWLGVYTHYTLDLLGNVRGLAFLYPHPKEYDVPFGVTVSSRWATPVTLVVTAFDLAVAALVVHFPRFLPVVTADRIDRLARGVRLDLADIVPGVLVDILALVL